MEGKYGPGLWLRYILQYLAGANLYIYTQLISGTTACKHESRCLQVSVSLGR
jgi:hypothetical protein